MIQPVCKEYRQPVLPSPTPAVNAQQHGEPSCKVPVDVTRSASAQQLAPLDAERSACASARPAHDAGLPGPQQQGMAQ